MTSTGLLTIVSLILATFPVFQQPVTQNQNPENSVIKLNVRVVNLNVSVMDIQGRKVAGLKREDFLVTEDRVPQEIVHFETVNAPVNLVLLLDLSGSIGNKLNSVKRAAVRFIDLSRPGDTIAIAAFTSRFILVSEFTSDRDLLRERISRLEHPRGDTAFYDATWKSFDLLKETGDSRQAMVILTDGVDSAFRPDEEGSRHSFEELLDRAQEEDVTVYPIYFDTEPESGEYYSAETFSIARRQLKALGEQTGGTWFQASRVEDLDGVYRQVAEELHTLYSIAYAAGNSGDDGKWRAVSVKVNREGIRAKTKRGYFAR